MTSDFIGINTVFFYVKEFHAEEHECHRRPSDIISYLGQGCTGAGSQTDRTTNSCTVAPSIWGPPITERASCHPPGTQNFEVTQIFLENVSIPALGLLRMGITNSKFLEARFTEFQKFRATYMNKNICGLRQTGNSCGSVGLNMGMA